VIKRFMSMSPQSRLTQESAFSVSRLLVTSPQRITNRVRGRSRSGLTLAAAVLGFFVITLDAVVVNVALPSIRADLGGGITGLQWVVDGYTLMFAALLLTAGSLSDRIGARRAFAAGLALFVAASAACGLAPTLGALVAARFVQGAAAAVLMPSSMASSARPTTYGAIEAGADGFTAPRVLAAFAVAVLALAAFWPPRPAAPTRWCPWSCSGTATCRSQSWSGSRSSSATTGSRS
jgi:MFS family permease